MINHHDYHDCWANQETTYCNQQKTSNNIAIAIINQQTTSNKAAWRLETSINQHERLQTIGGRSSHEHELSASMDRHKPTFTNWHHHFSDHWTLSKPQVWGSWTIIFPLPPISWDPLGVDGGASMFPMNALMAACWQGRSKRMLAIRTFGCKSEHLHETRVATQTQLVYIFNSCRRDDLNTLRHHNEAPTIGNVI